MDVWGNTRNAPFHLSWLEKEKEMSLPTFDGMLLQCQYFRSTSD